MDHQRIPLPTWKTSGMSRSFVHILVVIATGDMELWKGNVTKLRAAVDAQTVPCGMRVNSLVYHKEFFIWSIPKISTNIKSIFSTWLHFPWCILPFSLLLNTYILLKLKESSGFIESYINSVTSHDPININQRKYFKNLSTEKVLTLVVMTLRFCLYVIDKKTYFKFSKYITVRYALPIIIPSSTYK